jgi:hypothetical protein
MLEEDFQLLLESVSLDAAETFEFRQFLRTHWIAPHGRIGGLFKG